MTQQELRLVWNTHHTLGIKGKVKNGQFAIRLFPLNEKKLGALDTHQPTKVIFTRTENMGYSAWPEVRFKNYFHAYAFAHKLARQLNCEIEDCLNEELKKWRDTAYCKFIHEK